MDSPARWHVHMFKVKLFVNGQGVKRARGHGIMQGSTTSPAWHRRDRLLSVTIGANPNETRQVARGGSRRV